MLTPTRAGGRNRAGRERGELQIIPPVEREILDLLVADDRADRGSRPFEAAAPRLPHSTLSDTWPTSSTASTWRTSPISRTTPRWLKRLNPAASMTMVYSPMRSGGVR